MAQKKRLSPNQLAEVKSNFAGLKQIQSYTPINDDYEVSAIQPIETEIDQLLVQEAQVEAQLAAIRDEIAEKGADFVRRINGAVQQVIAQYGDDSAELQALGRKRKSDRATRRHKNGGDTPNG